MKIVLVLVVFFCTKLSAKTYQAASCNESDIQAAYQSEQASPVDGDIIAIPAGTCTWPEFWNFSPLNSLTFQGAGAVSATQGGASVTGTDHTIIEVTTSNASVLKMTTAANKTYRITGIAFYRTSGEAPTNGAIELSGVSTAVRFDHNHLKSQVNSWRIVYISGSVEGVADHNAVDQYNVNNPFAIENGRTWNGDTGGFGDKSWAEDSYWGSSRFFFIEDNWINQTGTSGNYINDCSVGGRQVVRYNTFLQRGAIQAHEGIGESRGCRAGEIYKNTFQNTTSASGIVGTRSGTVLVWGNNIRYHKNIVQPTVDRVNNLNGIFVPLSWAECGNGNINNGFVGIVNTSGTAVTLVSGNSSWNSAGGTTIQFPVTSPAGWPSQSNPYIYINGIKYTVSTITDATHLTLTGSAGTQTNVAYHVPSVWDGNVDDTGYPCLDMAGRGKGDLLTGSFAKNNRIDTVTGTATWPHQVVDPIYVWNNTSEWPGDSGNAVIGQRSMDVIFRANRDYYQQMAEYCFGPVNNSCGENPDGIKLSQGQTVPFTGAVGVGQGLLSARPVTCTAGVDAATGKPAPGVGYWATDQNVLYVCNPTNTWNAYYTPYTYPHPLTQSGGPPKSPSNLTGTPQT